MLHVRHIASILLLLLVFGCNSTTATNPTTYTGTPISIGTGTANTWVYTNASGNLSAVGVTISDAALASIGTKDSMFELPMPAGVSCIIKSIALDYATHDAAPYNKPHIDPHFFLLDMSARMSMMGGGKDGKMPTNMMMPSGYTTDSVLEPMMGVHWMDTTSSEFHGTPFQCAFDYGTSMGSMVFYEVMCDKSSLEGHKSITNTIRQPSMMGGGMMMTSIPASYKVSYDATAKTTTIELDGF